MAKKLAIVFGIIFVLVGALGFIGGLGIVGASGVFETNTLHDIVHLLTGVVLLVVAFMSPGASALWLKIIGVVYLVVAILGFLLVPSGGSLLGLIDTNLSDHILHIVLGVVLFLAGMYAGKGESMAAPMSSMPSNSSSMGGGTM